MNCVQVCYSQRGEGRGDLVLFDAQIEGCVATVHYVWCSFDVDAVGLLSFSFCQFSS